jgi:hypothetical protein
MPPLSPEWWAARSAIQRRFYPGEVISPVEIEPTLARSEGRACDKNEGRSVNANVITQLTLCY